MADESLDEKISQNRIAQPTLGRIRDVTGKKEEVERHASAVGSKQESDL
ncbi:MAG TPA: hypothetical protein VLZ03_04360 [Thermodesulfobacteriota bacterium]|nr:hypothetical protein [Thermodesulfobacteriota bacterium]